MRISDWSSDVCSSDLPGHADYELEAAYQFGDIRASSTADAAKLDVSAYFVHAEVGYQFKAPWSPRVSVEYDLRSEEHTSELQSLMHISYAVFCLKKKNKKQ